MWSSGLNSIKTITSEHNFQSANSAVMGLIHFSVLAILIVTGSKRTFVFVSTSNHTFLLYVFLGLSCLMEHIIWPTTIVWTLNKILEDSQLTHELLKCHDGRDGVTGRDRLPGPLGVPEWNGLDRKKGDKGEKGVPEVVGPPVPPGPVSGACGGATYLRWGRTSCPSIGGASLDCLQWQSC